MQEAIARLSYYGMLCLDYSPLTAAELEDIQFPSSVLSADSDSLTDQSGRGGVGYMKQAGW